MLKKNTLTILLGHMLFRILKLLIIYVFWLVCILLHNMNRQNICTVSGILFKTKLQYASTITSLN